MPSLADDQNQGSAGLLLFFPLLCRLIKNIGLDVAAPAVEFIKAAGYIFYFPLIIAVQQSGPQGGIADAAGGIDARPQNESGVIASRRLGDAADVGEGLDAG